MKAEQEYIRDLTEIRSMMEKSTRFLSLAGWSGIMAGVYALIGAFVAFQVLYPSGFTENAAPVSVNDELGLFLLSASVLVLAIGTAVLLSYRKSVRKGEKFWNATARRLVINLAIPLATGGIFIVILYGRWLSDLIPAAMLLFYGMALLNASKFTFEEMRYLGIIELVLGLASAHYPQFGLIFWAFGFGIMHIIYGIYLHVRYET